jgi:threonine dehydratase
MRTVPTPTLADVERAVRLPPTPVVESDGFSLKLETLQPTGSFKVRGALNALSQLNESVATASAGNFGLAVAWAAGRLGIGATVVVAETASPAKIEALRRFPIELVIRGGDYAEAERYALTLPGRYVSPYNDTHVIAGNGTLALELPDADTIVAPLGGGGLAAGVALAAPGRVVGVVPAAFPAMRASLDAGRLVDIEGDWTIADALHGNIEAGSVTFDLVRDRVDDVVEVTEEEIEDAMRFLFREHGLVTEGAGATAVAAVRAGKVEQVGETVAVISGRNVTSELFARVLDGRARG